MKVGSTSQVITSSTSSAVVTGGHQYVQIWLTRYSPYSMPPYHKQNFSNEDVGKLWDELDRHPMSILYYQTVSAFDKTGGSLDD